MRSDNLITLKPQDVVLLLKIVASGDRPLTQAALAESLSVPASTVSQSLKRGIECNLFNQRRRIVLVQALGEFLIHGIRYVYPAHRGRIVRGIPTASAAPPLDSIMDTEALSWPPVWATSIGTEQGYEIIPLIPSIEHIPEDPAFYELLTLVDALREGRTREKEIAADLLMHRLNAYQSVSVSLKPGRQSP